MYLKKKKDVGEIMKEKNVIRYLDFAISGTMGIPSWMCMRLIWTI